MVGISEASGVVYIDQVRFLSTNAHDLPDVYPLATGLIINQTNVQMENSLMVKVTNSLFSQSDHFNIFENLLLFYMLLNDPDSTVQVLVSQTNFSSVSYDPGWAAECGMVYIQIVSYKDAYIEFNGVQFLSNKFKPEFFSLPLGLPYNLTALLHIVSKTDHRNSTRVKIESSTFLNNYAAGIAVFQGYLFLDVINTQCYGNNADFVLLVANYEDYFITITLKQSTFANNTGGQLMLFMGNYLLVKISGLQIISNTLLPDYDGLFVFKGYNNLIADVSNVRYEFNHIVGEGSGFYFASARIRLIGQRFYVLFLIV